MDKNDPRRIKAYIVYLLETVANDEGSTWVWLDNLIDQCVNVLEFPYHTEEEMDATDDKIIQCIKEMLDKRIISIEEYNQIMDELKEKYTPKISGLFFEISQ